MDAGFTVPSPPHPTRLALARHLKDATETPLSGEDLAQELGITRAAVSKHLAALREVGFVVDSSPGRGYRLLSWPDALRPEAILPLLETSALGHTLVCVAECPSTNTLAFEQALGGAPHGFSVLAERQTAGRGRRGRQWHSPAGAGIYLSVVLRPDLQPQQAPPLTLACAVAVAEALEQAAGVSPRLKWPNDLLLDGRKVAGILVEMSAEPDQVAFLVVGVGVNVSTVDRPADVAALATALDNHARDLNRPALVAALLQSLETWTGRFTTSGVDAVREPWRSRAAHLGRAVRVDTPGGSLRGIAEDLDPMGALLVRDAEGQVHSVLVGDVWMD